MHHSQLIEPSGNEPADAQCQVPGERMRKHVERLEFALAALPQIDLQTQHYLSGGIYARQIFIPEGTWLTGAVHNKDHINVLIGDILVITDEGPMRLTGHHTIATKAGMKRAGIALKNTMWTTLVRTDLTDLAAIEDEITPESARLQTRIIGIEAAFTSLLEN